MTNFSNKFKNSIFGPIFPIFGSFFFLFKKSGCHAQEHMSLEHHNALQEKLMSWSQKTFREERWKDRRIDGYTIIHRTLLVTAGAPNKVLKKFAKSTKRKHLCKESPFFKKKNASWRAATVTCSAVNLQNFKKTYFAYFRTATCLYLTGLHTSLT